MMPDMSHPARKSIPREVLREMLARHGGRFHGPMVEHLRMEEGAFWRFLDEVIETASRAGNVAVAQPVPKSEPNLKGSHVHGG